MSPHEPHDGPTGRLGTDVSALDDRLRLLSHRDRRNVIETFADTGVERLPVAALADVLADDEPDDRDCESLYLELHHVHLPKLERADVVTYHVEESIVEYRGDDLVETNLETMSAGPGPS